VLAVVGAMQRYGVSERRACAAFGFHRTTLRRPPRDNRDEDRLRHDIIRLSNRFGRYGYRRITAMLKAEGWRVNHKRVERLWREEGLKIPKKQPKRGRLYLNDGSCIRLRPLYLNHVWSYDFVADTLVGGVGIRMLTVIDEFTRECLCIQVAYSLKSDDVLEALGDLFLTHGLPEHIRSDNGSEFTAGALREWLRKLHVKTAFIEPGSPWENGFNERFNGSLRDECLNRERFYTLKEAQVIIEAWRQEYNHIRPHSSLNYRPPAPLAIVSMPAPSRCVGASGAGMLTMLPDKPLIYLNRLRLNLDTFSGA
jgi:putative transposase